MERPIQGSIDSKISLQAFFLEKKKTNFRSA
jgi:hypothetical protein